MADLCSACFGVVSQLLFDVLTTVLLQSADNGAARYYERCCSLAGTCVSPKAANRGEAGRFQAAG